MSQPTIVSKPNNDIPILGQPFKVDGWFLTMLLKHECGTSFMAAGQLGMICQCPGCKRAAQFVQIGMTPSGIQIGLASVVLPDAPASEPLVKP